MTRIANVFFHNYLPLKKYKRHSLKTSHEPLPLILSVKFHMHKDTHLFKSYTDYQTLIYNILSVMSVKVQ